MALIRVNGGNNTSKQLILYEQGYQHGASGSFSTWGTASGWKPKAWTENGNIRLESGTNSGARLTSNSINMSKFTRLCIHCYYQRYSTGGSSAGWISLSTQPYHDVGRITYKDINNGQGNGSFTTKVSYSYNGNLYFIISCSGDAAVAIDKIWLERD